MIDILNIYKEKYQTRENMAKLIWFLPKWL